MTTLLLVSFCVVVFAAAAQAVTGFGFALVAVPLLALVIDPRTAVVAVTTIGLALSTSAASRERAHVRWSASVAVSLAGLVGMPAGLLLLSAVDERVLSLVIAVVVLTFAALLRMQVRVPPGRKVELAAGVTSGALLAATGMNGPPLVMAFQAMGLPPREFRATLQAAFTAQAAMVVIGLVLTHQFTGTSLTVCVAAVPALVIGWLLGDRLFRRLSTKQYQSIVFVTLLLSGAITLVRAVLG